MSYSLGLNMQQEPTISHRPEAEYSNSTSTPPPTRKKDGWKSALSTIIILIAAPLVALFLTGFVFQSYEVDGPSMQPTLENQDRLIVWKIPRTIARIRNTHYIPARGDVIVFVKRGISDFGEQADKQLIKRVIALPGERVVVHDNVITVYNKEHPDGFNPDVTVGYSKEAKPTTGNVDLVVREGEVFVCGDNRSNSLDSRAFGAVSSDDIIGKLAARIYPFNQAEIF
jgi:signal peptidase I